MSIVKNIQSLCKHHNTSIPRLEKELGFSNGSMYNWDKNSPSIDKIQKVADHFGVSPDFLLYGFEKSILISRINFAMAGRTTKDISLTSGIDRDYLDELRNGHIDKPPSPEIIRKYGYKIFP